MDFLLREWVPTLDDLPVPLSLHDAYLPKHGTITANPPNRQACYPNAMGPLILLCLS